MPRAERAARRAARGHAPPRLSLTARILALNIIALGLLAGSLLYIDSYRKQLIAERFAQARNETEILAAAVARIAPPDASALRRGSLPYIRWRNLVERLSIATPGLQQQRLRIYGQDGALLIDSLPSCRAIASCAANFRLTDPASQPLLQKAARLLDRSIDTILGAPPVPDYQEPATDNAAHWPEVLAAWPAIDTQVRLRFAPDRTPIITAATRIPPIYDVMPAHPMVLLTLRNEPDITQSVRDARQTLAIIVGVALAISVLLSLFLARTIVEPLRQLMRAAVRVRLGRDRAVVVPRLPERRDEIGLLARAVSDMSAALRQRIDAVESFAADVAHELKNPLASLRSAVETLEKVTDPALHSQLTAIAAHDVQRIDRLVTEIADASRIDAELSRATFERVDIGELAAALVGARRQRGIDRDCAIAMHRLDYGPTVVAGDAARLERVLVNLIDNAVSFSPPGGRIDISISTPDDLVVVEIADEGPGIPEDARERVFERFHSLRPAAEDFGSHSGLGLAIARTIIAAHDGRLTAHGRVDGRAGARLVIELPAWHPREIDG